MSSFIIPIAVFVGVTVAVTWLSVTGLRTYLERRTRRRNEAVAEQVKKQLADLRNSRPPQQKRLYQDDYDVEDTGHEGGQWAKEVTGQSASQAQGTVGQDAVLRRATEAEPWVTFHRGSVFDRQGEYDRAVEAYQQAIRVYQQVIDSGHPEDAPRAAFDLGLMLDKLEEYNLAEEAYQQAINSGHPEVAPKAMRNLRGLAMKLTARESGGP